MAQSKGQQYWEAQLQAIAREGVNRPGTTRHSYAS